MNRHRIVDKPQYDWTDPEGNRIKGEAVMAAEPRRRYARVMDADGHIWVRGNTRWTCQTPVGTRGVTQVGRLGWSILVGEYGPITVLVEDPRKSAKPPVDDDRHEPDWYHDGVKARLDGRLCRICGRREPTHDEPR